MKPAENVWNNALPFLHDGLSAAVYNGFISDIVPLDIRNNTLFLLVDDSTKQDYLRQRYATTILDFVNQANGRNYALEFVLPGEVTEEENGDSGVTTLNPRYTFDTFVIGRSNHFAHAAANVVANNPGKSYNPLYIYGGVGLGKTHLMHAIGNQIHMSDDKARIIYVTSENFTNEMISGIRSDRNEEFRSKYRNVDVLMIDDIQFISNKDAIQVEFFNTFNQLYEDQKQIVISSDKPPKDISGLEDRLRSRFEWGLQVDVQTPDYETRVAILQKKAETENLVIPMDVLAFIAEHVKSNIRELEGTLTRVMAYSSLLGQPITLELTKEALGPMIGPDSSGPITLELIKSVTADYFGLAVTELESKKRSRNIAYPRQVAMYLSRELTEEPLQRIGQAFGDRHHSTVIHDSEKIAAELQENEQLKNALDDIAKRLSTR